MNNQNKKSCQIQDFMERSGLTYEDAENVINSVENQKARENEEVKEWKESIKRTKKERRDFYKEKKQQKLQKRLKKARVIKDGQENVCRWIKFEYNQFERNGNKGYKHPHRVIEYGLQISNKIYLNNGKFKYRNNKGLKVLKKYDGVPDWASPKIKELYNNNINKNENI